MSQTSLRLSALRFFWLLAAMFGACVRLPAAEANLDAEIAQLCEQVKIDRAAGKFDLVEQKRQQRWKRIQAAAGNPHHVASRWVAAYKAIQDVDGSQTIHASKLTEVGLLNRMDYKAACERLRGALKEAQQKAQADGGTYLGELATRLFEIAQQARACYRDALVPGSPNCVATIEELKSALVDAGRIDPCCIMATPMLLFLEEPKLDEAFLRAEFREDFKKRQTELVKLSHRVKFFDDAWKPDKGEADGPKAEHVDDPVLPWHALTELDKARSLDHLLRELDWTSYLAADLKGPHYYLPGKSIVGRDGLSDPFALLYGRFLLCRVVDKKGRLRAAELILNAKGEWQYRYLDVLRRLPPANAEQESSGFGRLVANLPIREKFSLSGEDFAICDFPIEECEAFMSSGVPQFCAKNVALLPKMRSSRNQHEPKALKDLESERQHVVLTSPTVSIAMQRFISTGDRTKHPLVDLMKEPSFNPLVIVSDDDGSEVQPNLIPNPNGDPYLLLGDGARLFFELDGDGERVPSCYVEYPGATTFMPLHFHSIPLTLLEAGKMGAAFFDLLVDSGYSESEAEKEMQKCVEKPEYIPSRFETRWKARSRSTKTPLPRVMEEMLLEKGWEGNAVLVDEISRLYAKYGFRYLRDKRGNWITNGNFALDQGVKDTGAAVQTPDELRQYPFDFRSQDGKQRIDSRQIYAWKDYEAIKKNIYEEHLKKVLRMHPCFPAWDLLVQDAAKPLENPSQAMPFKDETDFNRRFDAKTTFLENQQPLGDEVLTAPCADWLVNGESNRATTLANLHNELVRRIHMAAVSSSAMELYAIIYEAIESLQRTFGDQPWFRNAFKEFRRRLDKSVNKSREKWQKSTEAVFAVQLEAARYFAEDKLFHLAMVHYNDLLLQQHTSRYENQGDGLFEAVADSKQAEKFAKGIQSLVEGQRLVTVAQLELGGVLNAAGLHDSAHALWQRIVDEHRQFLVPTVNIATETAMSYGIRLSDRATAALRAFDDVAERARQSIEKYGLAPQWRAFGDAALPKQKQLDETIATIEQAANREEARERIAPERQREIERALAAIKDGRDLNFRTWLRYRKALLPRGNLALRPLAIDGYRLHPEKFCPASYVSETEGFDRPVAEVLSRADADALAKWCGMGIDEAIKSPISIDACFLLGWYWLDAGQPAKARAAFMELCNVLEQRADAAKKAGNRCEELTHRLSRLSALLGASSIVSDMPGVSVIKSDLSAFLTPQILWWERQWFAAALYAPHASAEGRRLERQAEYLQVLLMAANSSWRAGRYFLRDYTYVYGAVPDWLAWKAFQFPELFNAELKKEEIAKKNVDEVEDDRWALLTAEHAKNFFDKLKIDSDVRQGVVDLAK